MSQSADVCDAGNFDMADVHNWLSLALPDVPPRAPSGDSGVLYFQGAVYSSILKWYVSSSGHTAIEHLLVVFVNVKMALHVTRNTVSCISTFL